MAGYIGSKASVVSSGVENKKVITATAGQTSFTGLTYSPNRVHVFQNGVRLVDGTDYTATDGTSLTLTVGALADDQVVVVSYSGFQTSDTVSSSAGGTFTGDVNFTGAFTSQGIDDNATSTAMTLDASGNLLVGSTSFAANFNDPAGIYLSGQYDYFQAIRSGGAVAGFSRNSSDGSIVNFGKDGSTVGSIQADAGMVTIGSGTTNLNFRTDSSKPRVIPRAGAGSASNGLIDLGDTGSRFKDLYLSSGVFLGGTGSANKLSSYEEGTWTPSYPSGWTAEAQYANYTKVGRFCYYNAKILVNNTSSGNFSVGGLPFTNGVYAKTHGAQMFEQVTLSTNRTQVVAFTSGNSNSHEFYQLHSAGGSWYGLSSSNINSNSEFYIQGVIVTA